MLKLFFINILLLLLYSQFIGQSNILKLNLVNDFGAKPDDGKTDEGAFKKAAILINKRKGNVILIIPKGKYIINAQKRNDVASIKKSINLPFMQGSNIFELVDCSNVTIVGEGNVWIKYKDGLYFGTFDYETGKKPKNEHDYNPSATKALTNRKPVANPYQEYIKNVADVGTCIQFIRCSNIEMKNISLDGNSDNFILGGTWGIGSYAIERYHYGIQIFNSFNIKFEKVNCINFGTDNVCITYTASMDINNKFRTKNIEFYNCDFLYSGRNNLSWVGGDNIKAVNCKFNYAGTKKIKTSPASGLDIEPENLSNCTNGVFINCEFIKNLALGIAHDYPNTVNMQFINCTIVALDYYSVRVSGPATHFTNCNINGSALFLYRSNDTTVKTFKNCTFTDYYKNDTFSFGGYVAAFDGNYLKFEKCSFIAKKLLLIFTEASATYDTPAKKFNFDSCYFKSTINKPTYIGGDVAGLLRRSIVKNSQVFQTPPYKVYIGSDEGNTLINTTFKDIFPK